MTTTTIAPDPVRFIPHDPQTDPRVGDIRYSWLRYVEITEIAGDELKIANECGQTATVTRDEWAYGTVNDDKRAWLRPGDAFRTPFRQGDIVRVQNGYITVPFTIAVIVVGDPDTFTDPVERLSVQPYRQFDDGARRKQDTAPYFIPQTWLNHTGRSFCADLEWLPTCAIVDGGTGNAAKDVGDRCEDGFDPWVGRHFVWPADGADVSSPVKEGE